MLSAAAEFRLAAFVAYLEHPTPEGCLLAGFWGLLRQSEVRKLLRNNWTPRLEFKGEDLDTYHLEQGRKVYQDEAIQCLQALWLMLMNLHMREAYDLLNVYLSLYQTAEVEKLKKLLDAVLCNEAFRNFKVVNGVWPQAPDTSVAEWTGVMRNLNVGKQHHDVLYTRAASSHPKTLLAKTFADDKLIINWLGTWDFKQSRRAQEVPVEEGMRVDEFLETHTGIGLHEEGHTSFLRFRHATMPDAAIPDMYLHQAPYPLPCEKGQVLIIGDILCAALRSSNDAALRVQAFWNPDTIALLAILSRRTIEHPEWDFSGALVSKRPTTSMWLDLSGRLSQKI